MTTQTRLAKLERELARVQRRNRWTLLGAALAVLGLLTVAATNVKAPPIHELLVARRVVIVDAQNRERASMHVLDNYPAIALRNDKGESIVMIGQTTNGPALVLRDDNSKNRIIMGIKEDGNTTLGLFDKDEKARVILP